MAVRIGELLLKEKLITPEQLQSALNQQKANGGKLGYNLVKMGFVKDEQITALLSKQYGVPATPASGSPQTRPSTPPAARCSAYPSRAEMIPAGLGMTSPPCRIEGFLFRVFNFQCSGT